MQPNPLALEHLSIADASPNEVVEIAAKLGIQYVSLWAHPPVNGTFPLVNAGNLVEVRRRMADTGVSVHNIECFDLPPTFTIDSALPALEIAAELHASSVAVVNFTDPEAHRFRDHLANLADAAADFKLGVNVEFISMGYTASLSTAARIVSAIPKAGLTIDMLHLVRTGSNAQELRSIDPRLLRYAQICDGPNYLPREAWEYEAMRERGIPGEGEFPLAEIVAALPRDIVVAMEVPLERLKLSGVSPLERARRILVGTRAIIQKSNP